MSLSEDQINTLRKTWKEISQLGMENVGLAILQQLFTDEPQTLKLFDQLLTNTTEITLENLKKNQRVANHATAVAEAIGKVVALLESPNELGEHFRLLCEVHRENRVENHHFDLLGPPLLKVIESVLKESGTDEVMSTWATAYGAIKSGIVNN